MNDVYLILTVIWTHWVADFVFQSDKMAKSKSSSIGWLTLHIAQYSTILWFVFRWKFAAANGIMHWIVDYVTSRVNSKLWAANERHWFFVNIGLDQAIHMSALIFTLPLSTLSFI